MSDEIKTSEDYFNEHPFTLLLGNQRYVFKGDLFAKMSKKCATLLEKGITEAPVLRRVNKEVFDAFIAACNLKPFHITSKNAYDLLYLSQEWEISTLEKFANDYINSKNVQPPNPIDYVQILVEKVKNNEVEVEDIQAVAAEINDAMKDDRFIALPPEIIFQTLLAANPRSIDPDLLVELTMQLFTKKPSTGIPLTFLTNFEQLSPKQRSTIFHSRKMHEIDVNYFVAWTLSFIRNRASSLASEFTNRCTLNSYRTGENILKDGEVDQLKYHEHHYDELTALTQQIEDQEKEIEELTKLIKADLESENQSEESRRNILKEHRESVKELEDAGEEMSITIAGTSNIVKNAVEEQITQLREELDNELQSISDDNDAKCNAILDEIRKQTDEQGDTLTKLQNRLKEYKEDVKKTNNEISEAKCALTAKSLRDKLRHDEFVRDTEHRFEIFGSQQEWGINSQDVEKAERFIEELEAELQSICPIRGNNKNSPPTSPKMISSRRSQPQTPKDDVLATPTKETNSTLEEDNKESDQLEEEEEDDAVVQLTPE